MINTLENYLLGQLTSKQLTPQIYFILIAKFKFLIKHLLTNLLKIIKFLLFLYPTN